MKSPLEAPPEQISKETSAKEPVAPSVIDTSKMSEGKRAALELAESSRDPLDERALGPALRRPGTWRSSARDARRR